MDPSALIPIVLVAAAFYLLILRPAQRRQKEAQAVVSRVAPGVRVMTTAGLFGTVAAVDGDQMDLEIAPGVTVRYVTAAVAKVLDDVDAVGAGSEPATGTLDAPRSSSEDDTPAP